MKVQVEITKPLPPGFLVAGAARGLLKKQPAVPVLPQRQLVQSVVIRDTEVRPYAALCGFTPDQGVPMTWPHVLSFPLQMRLMMAGDFPYPAMGMIHLGNLIQQRKKLHDGDDLRLTCWPGALCSHRRGQVISMVTEARRDGALVWSATSFYLKRGVTAGGEPWSAVPIGPLDHKIDSWRVGRAVGRRYARLSGDANPIHTSALGARILGFPRPLAHGMWTKARAIAILTRGVTVDAAEAEVSFQNPLFLPGEAELYAAPDGAVRDFECRAPGGNRVHLRGRLNLL